MRNFRALLALAAILMSITAFAETPSFNGRWNAQVTINGTVIPFRLDISGDGADRTGTLFNGEEKQTTTSAKVEGAVLELNFEHYLTKLIVTNKDGKLDGKVQGRFEADRELADYAFQAQRYSPAKEQPKEVPSIEGLWEVPFDSPKGERAWRFIVRQSGPDVSAAILRVDGDTGALTGSYQDGIFHLSHFDGSRPLVLDVTPTKEGTLDLQQHGGFAVKNKLIAYRPEQARAKGLPEPASFTGHTTVRDPNERFAFSFPDVNGKVVSNDDPRFQGKVYLAIVTGTWCSNCHDEAQYLVQLYSKYHDRGLEIVALDFEEPEQQESLARERAFVKKYGVPYTYLIAGAPTEMWEKVPQAVNLNTWPATFFVGRDGRVKKIHAGFAATATGDFNRQLKEEFTSTIEHLLVEGDGERAKLFVPTEAAQ